MDDSNPDRAATESLTKPRHHSAIVGKLKGTFQRILLPFRRAARWPVGLLRDGKAKVKK